MFDFRRAFGVAAIGMLVGCGGSQPPISANLAPSQPGNFERKRGSSGDDLLYVTPLAKSLVIYSYPGGQVVGRVDGLDGAAALCGDNAGDVFIEEHGGLFKYSHGGTTPITEVSASYGGYSCSVDPASGKLALTENGWIVVYPSQQQPPVRYNYSAIPYITSAAYDNNGDLFVAGYGMTNSGNPLLLAELPKGGSALNAIVTPPKLRYGAIQWDGQYIAVATAGWRGHAAQVQQLSVSGSSAQIVHSAKLKPGQARATAGLNFAQQGNVMVMQVGHHTLSFWNYPNGGKPEQTINLGKGNQNLAGWPVFSADPTANAMK